MGALVDIDVIQTVVTITLALIALYSVPRALTAAKQKAELESKDRVIATREQDNRALRDHQLTLTDELAECKLNSRKAESDMQTWQARYEEASKYTAPEA